MDIIKIRAIANRLDSSELFRAWLQSNVGNGSVGRAQAPCGCPIANYLRDTEKTNCSVGAGSVWTSREEQRICRTPTWANIFIRRIDSTYADGFEISAQTALAALDFTADVLKGYS